MLVDFHMRCSWFLTVIMPVFLIVFQAPASRSEDRALFHAFTEWQVLDVRSAQPVPFDEWIERLDTMDVIYLGEEHHNKWHIEAALRILRALLNHNRRPVLAMEMFGWDGQAGLDQYLFEGELSRDRFLEAARWEQNWGGSFEEYGLLIGFAQEHHLPVLALNPPRPLVRRVASQGLLHALADADMHRWGIHGETFIDNPAYRDIIIRQLRLCHGGLSDEGYQRMYEASLFRDEGMAKTITDHLGHTKSEIERRAGPLVSYTGGGHIQYHLPVPDRVDRKTNGSVKQTTVYLTSFGPDSGEEVNNLLKESIADYVWLTPVSAHGPAKRCR